MNDRIYSFRLQKARNEILFEITGEYWNFIFFILISTFKKKYDISFLGPIPPGGNSKQAFFFKDGLVVNFVLQSVSTSDPK
jgi:hypothetical protein